MTWKRNDEITRFRQQKDDYGMFEVELDLMIHEDLSKLLTNSKGYKSVTVDFSLDCIDKIESFYIDIMKGVEPVSISQSRLDRIMIAYVGEAVINNAGGHWELCDEPKNRNYGVPRIVGWGTNKNNNPVSPVGLKERIKQDLNKGVLSQTIKFCSDKDDFLGKFFKNFKEES